MVEYVKAQSFVALDLTVEEASVLVAVLRNIGGQPSGPRGKTDNVLVALEGLGIERAKIKTGSVYGDYTALYIEEGR